MVTTPRAEGFSPPTTKGREGATCLGAAVYLSYCVGDDEGVIYRCSFWRGRCSVDAVSCL